jgi:glycosyltransferase involved in cell wall biosynthesis
MGCKVSVCVIARDEAENLPRCLGALGFADEVVVVVDDRTTDASAEIARSQGARVILRRYEGNIAQKSFAVSQARNDWVLELDADEVVSPELARGVESVVSADAEDYSVYEVNRITFHLGRWIRHGAFFPNWVPRLYRHARVRWAGVDPHGHVVADGPIGRLSGLLHHYSYRDLADQIARVQSFSEQSARDLWRRGERARAADLCLRPSLRFVRDYVLKGGFRDGVPGLVIAAASSFYVFLKYAKLWEIEHASRGRPGARSQSP